MTSQHDLNSSPSIVHLFQSARKLLAHQPRVENRNLRKENYRMQKNMMAPEAYGNNNRVLELLSPLSIDEIKSSPPYGNKQAKQFQPPNNNVMTENTPASMNDSPPFAGSNKNGSDVWNNKTWTNNGQQPGASKTIKKEPVATVTPIQIQSEHSQDFHLYEPQYQKSNLTSSLSNNDNAKNKDASIRVECHNCHTLNTPLWRKDPEGNTLCNACGLFLKLHGSTRPLSLKTDVIKKRSSRKVNIPKTSSSTHSSRPGSFQERSSFRATYEDDKISSSASLTNIQSARYKNVLILPKPSGGAGSLSGPSSVKTPSGTPMRSIPIPSTQKSFSSAASSPASFTSGSAINVPSASNTPSNQLFKRKKSDLGLDMGSDNIRRGFTPSSYGNNLIKRTPSISSSMQARSFQRKGSNIALSSMNPGNSSLTYNNVSLLNRRSSRDINGGYFDFQRSNNMPVETPGSITSHSSFTSLHAAGAMNHLNHESFSVPSGLEPIGNAEMDALQHLPPVDPDTPAEDYFKNFTLLQLHDDELLNMDSSMAGMGNKYEVNIPSTKSTLTSGLRVNSNQPAAEPQELKDLDWLKFEI